MRQARSTSEDLARARPRVLVIDADEFARRRFRRELERRYEVDTAAGGSEASALVAKRTYDAVLSGLPLGEGRGFELLERVRGRDPDLPVVLLTGAPLGTGSAERGGGAYRCLVEPVGTSALYDALDEAVRGRALAPVRNAERGAEGRARGKTRRSFELALDDLFMLYQPIVDVREGSVFAREALVRSRSRELTHPAALLEAAESLGEVVRLGRRIRARLANELTLGPRSDTIFLNLHAEELLDEELYVEGAPLARFAEQLVLELDARSPLGSVDELGGRIARLGRLGYRIAVEERSLSPTVLRRSLAPDFVKVGRAIVGDVESRAESRRFLRSLLELEPRSGVQVILEGVETRAEAEALVDLGGRLLQGYYFGRPAPSGRPLLERSGGPEERAP